jgi:hypothetical protein
MPAGKRKSPPGGTDGPSLKPCEKRAAVHGSHIAPKAPLAQVRRVAKPKPPPPTPEKWVITRELACIRGAAQIVVGHHQTKRMSFTSVEIVFGEPLGGTRIPQWWMPRSSSSESLRTDLKVFCAPLVAEISFAEFPPLEFRAHDYFQIKNCASCLKFYYPKTTLTQFIENAVPDVFAILIREHLSVGRIARALLKHGRLDGEEILKLLRGNDDLG